MNKRRSYFFQNLSGGLSNTKLRYDWILLGTVVCLCVFGLAFLSSTLSARGPAVYQREFLHQLIFGLWVGGVGAFILSRVDYHFLFRIRNLLFFGTVGLLGFIAVFIFIADVRNVPRAEVIQSVRFLPVKPFMSNGAVRWIQTPITNFQPSEFAKFALLIYTASFLSQYEKEGLTWLSLKKPLYAFALCAFLIVIQPDLGSVILMGIIVGSGMWVAKVPLKMLIPAGILFMVFAGLLAYTENYRLDRIQAVLNPDGENAFQINQVKNAVINGGVWGVGYGNSEYKQNNLIPYASTDAIIGVIGEEMGFVFTIMFLSLYLVLFFRGLKIANEAPDLGGKAVATGIAVWIVSQAFLNVTGITGITPLKGLPLPFVSEGGSSLVINLAAVGVLLNISKQSVKESSVSTQFKTQNYFGFEERDRKQSGFAFNIKNSSIK